MKQLLLIVALSVLMLTGCEPFSLDDEIRERDIVADVLAYVCPDTVQRGQFFTVQISYPNVCGGEFKNLIIQYDTLNHVFLQPILHQNLQTTCPAVYGTQTISTGIHFNQEGTYEVIIVGNNSSYRKQVEVTLQGQKRKEYSLNFRFQNRQGVLQTSYHSTIHFPIQSPGELITFITDVNGVWDSTFTSTSSSLDYTIAGFQFVANRHVAEDGVIIIP